MALRADKHLHVELFLEGFLTIISKLAADHAEGGTAQSRQSAHASPMGAHVLHRRLATGAIRSHCFMMFSKSKHAVFLISVLPCRGALSTRE